MDKEVKANDSKEAAEMRKRAGVPEIDPDAKPSSSAPKIVSCATKHVKKLADLIEIFKGIDKPTAIQTRSPSCTIPSYHKSHEIPWCPCIHDLFVLSSSHWSGCWTS